MVYLAGGVLVSVLIFGTLFVIQRIQQASIDKEGTPAQEEVTDLQPDQLIDTKSKGRMFGDRRAAQVLSMMKRPIRALLTDKSECWYMYFRMDIRDSTAIIARAKVPKSEGTADAIALEYLTGLIAGEVNGDQHEKAGKFLISLTVRNPKLGSYLFEKVIEEVNFYQTDDLIRDMAAISPEFRNRLAGQGYSTAFHPGLSFLSKSAKQKMVDELQSGWCLKEEYILSRHLSQSDDKD